MVQCGGTIGGGTLAPLRVRAHLPDESVDAVHLDPPFNSDPNDNVVLFDAADRRRQG